LYSFALNGGGYYDYAGGPFSGAEKLAAIDTGTSSAARSISYKRF
jgi:hypothetical protein